VAQEQRRWAQAEDYYQKALALCIEFNDRYSQASTYHQLGRVAQEQRRWEQALDYYLKALPIYVEFNDEVTLDIVLRTASPDSGRPARIPTCPPPWGLC